MLGKKVDDFLYRHGVGLKNKGVVVGVSGGPDSLALLHYLFSRRDRWNLSIVAAHVDHMFRGKESFDEAKFVEEFCVNNDIAFEVTHVDVPAFIKETGKNPQVASRECRYQFFQSVMEAYQFPYLALGHHGDDQIETILMRLTRGSTGKARAGILFKRSFFEGEILRPFLCLSRSEIEDYCNQNGLDPRRDPSNEKDIYSRNRFRKSILPFLKLENPQVQEHFQRFSEELESDEDLLQELTVKKMNKVMKRDKEKIALDINAFTEMPIPLQRRGIQLILKYLYRERLDSLSAIHIDQLFSLIRNSQPSGMLNFPNGLRVIRSYDELQLSFLEEVMTPYQYEISEPGTIRLPNDDVISFEFTNSGNVKTNLNQLILDCQGISLPIVIRTRKNGDRIKLKGMGGTKKIKEIFIEHKIPIHDRNQWPIVTDDLGQVLWVPGIKKADHVMGNDPDTIFIHLTFNRNESSRGQLVMKRDIEKVLITEEELQGKVRELAEQLTTDYNDRFPLAVGVLKGAMPFMADLLKRMDCYLEMDFMDVSSYGNTTVSSGEVKILKDLDTSVEGRDILIIEDIIDSGLTLSYLAELFRYRKAKSIKIVTLLDKPSGRKADIHADYVGFVVPDAFVVGYGLDYAEKYRNLPYIGVLKPEVYSNNK
jgi:hypoxanthine phosphoribosyltransferase